MARTRSASILRFLAATVIWAALLLGLWIGLADNTLRWDTIAGIGCALTAGAAMQMAARSGQVRLRVRWRWLARAAAAPWWIVRDTALVLRALLRGRPRGRLRPVRWSRGGDAPLDQGRRALAVSAGSAGPNQYVVAAADDEDVLLVHELEPARSVTAVDVVREDA
ncbi:MAG TPA: hypothetical protein VFT50_02400 [Baekduia sp.]|nr:hypothetical protein [Baekduia sp.]